MSDDWWWWTTPWGPSGPSYPPSGPSAPGAAGIEGVRGSFPPLANLVYEGVAELMAAQMGAMRYQGPSGPTGPLSDFLNALGGLLSTGLSGPAAYLVNTIAKGLAGPVYQGSQQWGFPLINALAWQINGTGPVMPFGVREIGPVIATGPTA